jgi:hypothetical protein
MFSCSPMTIFTQKNLQKGIELSGCRINSCRLQIRRPLNACDLITESHVEKNTFYMKWAINYGAINMKVLKRKWDTLLMLISLESPCILSLPVSVQDFPLLNYISLHLAANPYLKAQGIALGLPDIYPDLSQLTVANGCFMTLNFRLADIRTWTSRTGMKVMGKAGGPYLYECRTLFAQT